MKEFTKEELKELDFFLTRLAIIENKMKELRPVHEKIQWMLEKHYNHEKYGGVKEVASGKVKFTLPAGYWWYWFRDKGTLTPLSSIHHVIKDPEVTSDVEIDIPDYLKRNTSAEICVERVK